MQRENDKLRKQFNKQEITVEQFLTEYTKARIEYYEHECVRQKLSGMSK